MKLKMWFAVLPALMLMLSGCGGADREQIMTGSWRVRGQAMMMDAVKQTEGMSAEAARGVGMELGRITLDMNADKTFVLNGNIAVKGTWTLDKESGVATFTTTPANPPIPPQPFTWTGAPDFNKASTLTGKLDDDNQRFTLNLMTGALQTSVNLPEIVFEKADAS